MERFSIKNDFLTKEALERLQNFFQSNVFWTYGWQSNKNQSSFGHWNHDFLNRDLDNQIDSESELKNNPALVPILDIWSQIKKQLLHGHALVRCYANAHTFGIEGAIHQDSHQLGNYTTIVYVNPSWKPDWAGETVFFNDVGDIWNAVLPKPGRIVTFDGRIKHVARAVSRVSPALRVTLMFKTVLISELEDET